MNYQLVVIVIAAITYLSGLISPPHLMDDVDAAEAIQARNMLLSGDWVTQRLNGTIYLDKAPLKYWITAGLYAVLGVRDWVTRLPTAIGAIGLCWLVARMGAWTGSSTNGLYAGLVLSTSIGLYLFTRTVIPDILLTGFMTLSVWCFFRRMEEENTARWWFIGMYGSAAGAVLTKGLIGLVFPVGIALCYLIATSQFTKAATWKRLEVFRGSLLFLAIAAPWHVVAVLHNPPVFDFTLHAGEHFGGRFRGFFWFYFINEQALRFLNERWPRDYNTVPRIWFWIYHILWFFPWSFFLPVILRLNIKPTDRQGRARLFLLCWIGFVMLFFSLSTTQEYYSMPIYPAVALLLGFAMSSASQWLLPVQKIAAIICLTAAALLLFILVRVWHLPTPRDIFAALSQHPDLYTLSLGHMADLTLPAFAYLRTPLLIAAASLLLGGVAMLFTAGESAYLTSALMLVGFFQAARLALVVFDPYLSSYAVAMRLQQLPKGRIIICGKYNPLSSLFFYGEDRALQYEPDLDILEYGSLAPGAPQIEIKDSELRALWHGKTRMYVVTKAGQLHRLEELLPDARINIVFESGDKYLLANHP